MKPRKVYETYISFEERSAAMYLDLSIRFFENPELSWFWVEMAMEEKQHAGMLQHCREASVYAIELPDKKQLRELKNVFQRLERRLSDDNLSLDEAFAAATELEGSEINDIYSKLTSPINGQAHVLRRKMQLSVASHFDRLAEGARRFGASAQTQQRLAEMLGHK